MRFEFLTVGLLLVTACSKVASIDPVTHLPTPVRVGPDTPMSGGTEVGPGGDITQPDTGSAWFVHPTRVVHYCYSVSETFGFPKEGLKPVIEGAFADWRDYLDKKHIVFSDPELKLALTPVFDSACDGKEDLHFYFGTEDERVRAHKVYYSNPIGFPVRLSNQHDDIGNWGKGFIWIAGQNEALPAAHFPDWSKSGTLAALVRHEMGHVLGLGHIPGTIMAEEIHDLLRTSSPSQLAGIDLFNELYRCLTCAVRYEIDLPAVPKFSAEEIREDAYRFLDKVENRPLKAVYPLLGRAPEGVVHLTLLRHQGHPRNGQIHTPFVKDAKGEVEMVGSLMDRQPSYFPTGAPLFKIFTKKGSYSVESTDLEYRQSFYRNKDWSLEPIHLTIRYLTHYFRPAERAPVELLSDSAHNWLINELFVFVGVNYPLANFTLLGRTFPKPGEYVEHSLEP